MTDLVNAAPMVIDQGTNDLSTRVVPQSSLEIPQHLPKFYLFSEQGPMGDTYVDFDNVSLTKMFGDATFDINSKYFTHQTHFLMGAAAAGNNCVISRIGASDAKDVANIALYIDVLPTQVPLYVKNSDGSIDLDVNGLPTTVKDSAGNTVNVNGFKLAWIIDHTAVPVGTYQRGLLTQRNGIQVDGTTQSTQYPIFEAAASSPGEAGNKLALKLYAGMQTDIVPFPTNILLDGKMFPFYFQMTKLVDKLTGKTQSILNSFGSQYAKFVGKTKGIDPASGAIIDMEKTVTDQYINMPVGQETGLGSIYVYNQNLQTLLTSFYNAEKVISDSSRDSVINNTDSNIYAINFLSFTSSNGSPYQTLKLVDLNGSIRLTKNTNLFLAGSSDGTISESLLDQLVAQDMANYADPLHEYNDLVAHPESIVYDSGFTLSTKKALCKMISRRKDTYVALSTFAHDAASPTLADQYSVAVALKTIIELYPESATFGTPVMRGIIVAGSGEMITSLYAKRVPVLYEVLYKSARYMGAKNAAWKNGYAFDRAPLSILTQLKNIDVTWVPTTTRNTLWSAGINFVLNYKVKTQFFPALQTVYENDTSVLNSFFTTIAIAYLNKVAHAAWREFSGSVSLTNAQLEEKVNQFVANAVKDKFDGMFVIQPNATVTELDNLRGYSWTLPIKIYSNNLKTVMITNVQAYRQSDLISQ